MPNEAGSLCSCSCEAVAHVKFEVNWLSNTIRITCFQKVLSFISPFKFHVIFFKGKYLVDMFGIPQKVDHVSSDQQEGPVLMLLIPRVLQTAIVSRALMNKAIVKQPPVIYAKKLLVMKTELFTTLQLLRLHQHLIHPGLKIYHKKKDNRGTIVDGTMDLAFLGKLECIGI